MTKRHRTRLALSVVACLAFGLFFFAEGVSEERLLFGRAPYRALAMFWLAQASIWAFLTPLVVCLADRVPIEGSRRGLAFVVHLGIGISMAALAAAAVSFVAPRPMLAVMRRFNTSTLGLTVAQLEGGFHQDLLAYWIVLGAHHTLGYYRKSEERRQRALQLELEAARLRAQMADAQFAALRFRLHPSFLFTTLAQTQTLIREQHREDAETILSSLGDLLRGQLTEPEARFVTLRQELEHARQYLDVERLRLGKDVETRISAVDAALDVPVMRMCLRLPLETAIRHVVETHSSTTVVSISASRSADAVQLRVSCATHGGHASRPDGFETALSSTRTHLTALYSDRYELTISNDDRVLTVTMQLPSDLEQLSAGSTRVLPS